MDSLDFRGMAQHVSMPAHRSGHILDVIIIPSKDRHISDVSAEAPAL